MKCYKNLISKLLIIIETKYAFIKMLKSCDSKMSKIFLVRSHFISHKSITTMFPPFKQDNFPQKQSTSGKRKWIPNVTWRQNKNKWVAMKFSLRKNVF